MKALKLTLYATLIAVLFCLLSLIWAGEATACDAFTRHSFETMFLAVALGLLREIMLAR